MKRILFAALFSAASVLPGAAESGRKLVWHDEFDGSEIDASKWRFRKTMYGKDCAYTNNMRTAWVAEGLLHLRVLPSKDPSKACVLPQGLATHDTMGFRFGRLEMRARLPFRHGAWPSFWMQSTPRFRKHYGAEVDIFEVFSSSNAVIANLHKWDWDKKARRQVHAMLPDDEGSMTRAFVFKDATHLNDEFHVYALNWTPKAMTFSVDGKAFASYPIDDAHDFAPHVLPGMSPFRNYLSIILNNEVFTPGHGWCKNEFRLNPSDPLPIDYEIDYIRLWQEDGESLWQSSVPIIFDTDMIDDFDDVGALACLHAFADRGEAEILATVSSTRGNASVGAIETINGFYGREDLPVGSPKGVGVLGIHPGAKTKVDFSLAPDPKVDGGHYKYRKMLLDYPNWYRHADADDAPDATEVYRRALASQLDGSVVICSVGFLTNLRCLLESKGDRFSPLSGRDLVARKVRRLVVMACSYPKGAEYNVKGDVASAHAVFENWPTPIVFSDGSYGGEIYTGRALADDFGKGNPVQDVFRENLPSRKKIADDPRRWKRACFDVGGRASWDETAVWVAVRGAECGCTLECGRYRIVDEKGTSVWESSPSGPHRRLVEKTPKREIGVEIDKLLGTPPAHSGVRTYRTTNTQDFMPVSSAGWSEHVGPGSQIVDLDSSEPRQRYRGFGGSFAESSCRTLMRLPEVKRREAFKALFGPEGLALSMGRIHCGSSDYSMRFYTYDDVPNDVGLRRFSIAPDEKWVIPTIREALNVNSNLFFFSSAWSAPTWMKTSGSLFGGHLRKESFDLYADYIVRFIRAYEHVGISIGAHTIQNEPEAIQAENSPTMQLTAAEEAQLAKTLFSRLRSAGLSTRLWLHDHNYDGTNRVDVLLSDAKVRSAVSGIAWHSYAGDPSAVEKYFKTYPELENIHTEMGPVVDSRRRGLCFWGRLVLSGFNAGQTGFTNWCLALDENGEPNVSMGFSCAGLIGINSRTGEITPSNQYRFFRHVSPFVKPNATVLKAAIKASDPSGLAAKRLSRTIFSAFRNPDGSHVVVVVQDFSDGAQLVLKLGGRYLPVQLLPHSVTTVLL